MRAVDFFKQFVSHPRHTGAVAPSSKILGQVVTRAAHVAEADVVIEFGPGTGTITEVILESMKPQATFLALEINPDFHEIMRERFPNLKVYKDSAANARVYLERAELTHCDAIVSGLPWAVFDNALQDQILEAVLDVLRPGGYFSTYMYAMSPALPRGARFIGKMRAAFSEYGRHPLVWKNLPPAFVYYGRK